MKQETALKLLKAGENVFLTGSAGAGKTYTLNQYIQYLKARKISVAITASTGIAATHMNGMTIHTWAGIGIKDSLSDSELKRMHERKYLREHLEKVQVLIIDEISMLHARQLNLVNQVLKYFKESEDAFGGVQVIASGDFFQLPPVGKSDETNRDKFCFMSEAWVEAKFRVCYLTEQHRQAGGALDEILNAIRAQTITDEHVTALTQTKFQAHADQIVTRLYTHNANVDLLNQQQLDQIEGKKHQFHAAFEGNEKLVETLKSSVRSPVLLELKKGAKVMFVKNNFEQGYANGSIGEITGFVKDENDAVLPKVLLKDGTSIIVEAEKWSVENEQGKELASLTQIPLRLAWAITIHKSQGMTLESAEIDLSSTFEKGQGYVALSRLKSLEGLKLVGFSHRALELDRLALKADARFQELSEEAEAHFVDADLSKQHDAFIRRSGGLLNPIEIAKNESKLQKQISANYSGNTLEETKALFEANYDIEDIAAERQLTRSTIINHLGRLSKEQNLNIERIKPEEDELKDIRKAFKKLQKRKQAEDFNEDGSIKLKPLVEETKLSYEQVRLALLFIA